MRRKDREVTEITDICRILDQSKVMHIGMVDTGRPYVLPLNYGYTMENGQLTLYFHSALSGRKLEILKENPSVFCEIDVELGLNGQGDNACAYGYYFASVMGPGRASVITDAEEKKSALEILMKHQTGRDNFTYSSDLSKVTVVKVTLSSYSAKVNQQRD